MFQLATLLSLAAFVVADQTFQLTAVGNNINSPVQLDGNRLVLNQGGPLTLHLQEPDGYLSVEGQSGDVYLTSTPKDGIVLKSKADASSAWGLVDGHLRLNAAGINKLYACPDGDNKYYINGVVCPNGGEEVQLNSGAPQDAPASSAAPESSAAPSSAAPSSAPESSAPVSSAPAPSAAPVSSSAAYGNATVTNVESTLVTVTSCSDHHCTAAPSSAAPEVSSVNGGAQAKIAAGAFIAAGALLL